MRSRDAVTENPRMRYEMFALCRAPMTDWMRAGEKGNINVHVPCQTQ